jgi:hypothetical protein
MGITTSIIPFPIRWEETLVGRSDSRERLTPKGSSSFDSAKLRVDAPIGPPVLSIGVPRSESSRENANDFSSKIALLALKIDR